MATPLELYLERIRHAASDQALDALAAEIKTSLGAGFLAKTEVPQLVAAGKARRETLARAKETGEVPLEEPFDEPFVKPNPELMQELVTAIKGAKSQEELAEVWTRVEKAIRSHQISSAWDLALWTWKVVKHRDLALAEISDSAEPSKEAQEFIARVDACKDLEEHRALAQESIKVERNRVDEECIDAAFEIKYRQLERKEKRPRQRPLGGAR